MSDTEFVDGLRVYAPHEKAPDYFIANGEIDVQAMAAWCAQRSDVGKVRIVIKRSQGGKYYAAVDTYKRDETGPAKPRASTPVKDCPQPEGGFTDDDIPFMVHGKRAHWIA